MTTPSVVRTTTHIYPRSELDAMTMFYGSKRRVITSELGGVEWSHALDAALEPSNDRLAQMLTRKLRQDRHPQHAAEVQENIVPRTVTTYGTPTTRSSNHNRNQDAPTFAIPSFSPDGDELLLTPGYSDGLAETGNVQRSDKGIVADAMSLPVTCEDWDVQSIEGTETSDDVDAMEDVEGKPPTGPSRSDILSWCEQIAESMPDPLPLIPGSFERGVIGGMSTNDMLMIKGLIDPPVYIQFFDLSLFSCL